MGGYIWKHPDNHSNNTHILDDNTTIHQKTLFYINSYHGNCTTRFNIIQRLHSYLPSSYQIVQFDLPGFGLSSYLRTDHKTIVTYLTDAINLFLKEQQDDRGATNDYAIFTEFESSLIISQLFTKLRSRPSHILHFNPANSFFQHLCQKYTSYSAPLFVPYLFNRTLIQWYDEMVVNVNDKNSVLTTKFAILENNNKLDDTLSNGDDIFINLPIPFPQKRILKLDGDGVASLLSDCNKTILISFFKSFLENNSTIA